MDLGLLGAECGGPQHGLAVRLVDHGGEPARHVAEVRSQGRLQHLETNIKDKLIF